jgi:hypothetical protein
MTKDEALTLALEALECLKRDFDADQFEWGIADEAITDIKEALAQPEQNLSCKSTQARLATSWGYVKAQPAPVPPPWWPAIENILNEYGLQAIDFVADFKQALAQQEQEPVAEAIRARGGSSMTRDEIDTMWQQAMQESIKDGEMFTRYHFAKLVAAKEALAQPEQPDTDMAYTIALQRAIEWHCKGKAVLPDVAALCPHHAGKLNKALKEKNT